MNAKTIIKGAMGICGSSILKGIRFGPKEFLTSSIGAHLSVMMGGVKGIPDRSLSAILETRRVDVTIPAALSERGALSPAELVALLGILVANNPPVILEIGTFMGATTKAMAQNIPGAFIHTVDLPLDYSRATGGTALKSDPDDLTVRKRQPGREFIGTPFASRIKQHFCDTAKWDFSEARDATAFFIDGAHTYEYCKSDSERCYDLCKGKGVFLWHDCNYLFPGVVRLVREWRSMGRDVARISGTPLAYWKGV